MFYKGFCGVTLGVLLPALLYASPPPGYPAHTDSRWQGNGQAADGFGFGQQQGYPPPPNLADARGAFHGSMNQSACPWPTRHDMQSQQQPNLAFIPQQQQRPCVPQQPPHGVAYSANHYQTGSYPPPLRQDLQVPINAPQAPGPGWNMATGSVPHPSLSVAPHGEQGQQGGPQQSRQAQQGYSLDRERAPAPRRVAVLQEEVPTPVSPPRRSHRDARGGARRTAPGIHRHATPPRRERLRGAVGRSSDYRDNLRAVSPRPEVEHRHTRANRSSSGDAHQA